MLLSFLMKVEEDRGLSPLSSHSKPDTFKEWYAENAASFWGGIALIIVTAIFLVLLYCFLNEDKIRSKIAKNKAKREEENERVKQHLKELSRCYVTLTYCYDDKSKIIEHERGKAFYPEFPSREGYSFDGWFINTARTIPFNNDVVKDDIFLYAKWSKEA